MQIECACGRVLCNGARLKASAAQARVRRAPRVHQWPRKMPDRRPSDCASFKHPISSKSCRSAKDATISAAVRPAERFPVMHLRTTRSPTCVPATLAGSDMLRRKQKQKQQQQAIHPENHPAGHICIVSKQRTTFVNIN